MFTEPTLWGLFPLIAFIVLVFRKSHPVVAISVAVIIGAIMTGNGFISVAEQIQEGLGSFLAYVGLIIMAGGGLGKIAERTGVAQTIVSFIMNKVGINTPRKAILGTMMSSMLLTGSLGTLAGANAVIAPVIIPIVAAAGLSSTAVAIIFQGAGITGLWLGPFTPPMVTFMELTGLSYTQILLYASLPLSIIMLLVTYFFVKKTLPTTLKLHPYSKEDIAVAEGNQSKNNSKAVKQATAAFFVSLIGLIIYGLIIGGGSTFAIIVIMVTAIITGLVGRLKPNELMEKFFEGAKPLIWLLFLFVLFTPFINYVEQLGGFQAIANLLEPLVDMGGDALLVIVSTIIGAEIGRAHV